MTKIFIYISLGAACLLSYVQIMDALVNPNYRGIFQNSDRVEYIYMPIGFGMILGLAIFLSLDCGHKGWRRLGIVLSALFAGYFSFSGSEPIDATIYFFSIAFGVFLFLYHIVRIVTLWVTYGFTKSKE